MLLIALADVLPIRTCMDLQQMAPRVYYALFNDVDCTDFPFVPIPKFEAVLYGQNFTVSNLKIDRSALYKGKYYSSFIINVTKAKIFNLKIAHFSIFACGDFCGFLGFGLPDVYNIKLDVIINSAAAPSVVGGLLATVPACDAEDVHWTCHHVTVNITCVNCAARAIGAVIGHSNVHLKLNRIIASLLIGGDSFGMYYVAGLVGVSRAHLKARLCGLQVNFVQLPSRLVYGGVCALCGVIDIYDCYSVLGNSTELEYSTGFIGYITGFAAVAQDIMISYSYTRIYGVFAHAAFAHVQDSKTGHCFYYHPDDQGAFGKNEDGFTPISYDEVSNQSAYIGFDFYRIWSISSLNQGFPGFNSVEETCGEYNTCVGVCSDGDYFTEVVCQCPEGYIYSPIVQRCIRYNCRYIGDIVCDGDPDECHFVNDTYYCDCALNNTCLNGCPYCHGDCSIDMAGNVACDQCYVGWTGDSCEICASPKCDETLTPCKDCNGQCVIGEDEEKLCISCNTGWSGLSCEVCAVGYKLIEGICVVPKSRSSYLWYIVAIMVAITVLFAVLLYFVWRAVNSKESRLKRVYSCAEVVGPSSSRPKVRAPLAKLVSDQVKLEIPLDILQPAAKLAPIRTSSRSNGEIIKRVGVGLGI